MSQQKKIWAYVIGIVLIILVIKYSGLIFKSGQALLSISMPLIMGCAIAYALNILVVRLDVYKRQPFRLCFGCIPHKADL